MKRRSVSLFDTKRGRYHFLVPKRLVSQNDTKRASRNEKKLLKLFLKIFDYFSCAVRKGPLKREKRDNYLVQVLSTSLKYLIASFICTLKNLG